jgi:hypothetical protein
MMPDELQRAAHAVYVAYNESPEWHACAAVAYEAVLDLLRARNPEVDPNPAMREWTLLSVMFGMLALTNAPPEVAAGINAMGPMGAAMRGDL